MIGSIGVCPPWGQSISSLYAGDFGGNMDLPLVRPGATLFLPAFCPGGHVLVGDIHAAQGAGEIVGGGIETSGIVTLSLGSLRDRPMSSPRMIVDGHLFSVATHGDLRAAVSTGYSHLLDWIVTEGALNRWDAHQLISQVGRLEIGGLSSTSSTVAAGIAIDLLPTKTRRELAPWIDFAGQ
jgi:acetamidase/formamidase